MGSSSARSAAARGARGARARTDAVRVSLYFSEGVHARLFLNFAGRNAEKETVVDIGDPNTEREVEVLPLEEPIPSPAPAQEPVEEPVPG
jgi:hypothetical protein